MYKHTHTHTQSSLSPPTSSDELGLTGSAIKEEKQAPKKKGAIVNIRGMLNDAIRDASGAIGSDGPQV